MTDPAQGQLTNAQKRAMLAELLRRQSGVATAPHESSFPPDRTSRWQPNNGREPSFSNELTALASLKRQSNDNDDAYMRRISPYKGFLYRYFGLDKTYVRGEGCYLFDADGVAYADFVSQFGAVPFGHDPAAIWQALDQVRRESLPNLVIGSIPAVQGELAERLLAVAPPGLDHVVFTNSGAESVEAAIKLARCRTARLGILSVRDGFHGLTLGGMSASHTDFFQRGFGAPVDGFDFVPFGELAALEAALRRRPDFYAAFMVEVVQGEAGIHVAPPGYLKAVLELCHRFGVLLIVDEAQTGLGRTGKLFACEAEGTTPDILTLAKALGGGLMPIGACLYAGGVYTEDFDLRHGSTFAGNALACRAALASIDELTKDDQRLVRQVTAIGDRLRQQLQQLQGEYPSLVKEIRGRGLMLGFELNLDHVCETQSGLIAAMQQQGLLRYTIVSYLLNVEQIRIATSFTHGAVLRIEPPLTADEPLCDRLFAALRRLLEVLQHGDAGRLIGHLLGGSGLPTQPRRDGLQYRPPAQSALWRQQVDEHARSRFAFVVHFHTLDDIRRSDPSLEPFSDSELERLKSRLGSVPRPLPLGRVAVRSMDGRLAEGELIALPRTAPELLALQGDEAVELIQGAVDLAVERGAEVVGLAGFSSIVTYGGLALQARPGVRVTSGNSCTAWAAIRTVEAACARYNLSPAECTIAIVGATGAIGYALSLLCAERAGEVILIGNPRATEISTGRLREIARDCDRHIERLAASGRDFHPASFAGRRARRQTMSASDAEAGITVTTDIDKHLPRAHIVFTATSAVAPFISAHHLRNGAMVCDVSRPFNLAPDLIDERPDVRLVSGGLVQAPDTCLLGALGERDRPNVLVACAAETIILALSGYRSQHLCGRLDLTTIEELGRLAERMGFSAAD